MEGEGEGGAGGRGEGVREEGVRGGGCIPRTVSLPLLTPLWGSEGLWQIPSLWIDLVYGLWLGSCIPCYGHSMACYGLFCVFWLGSCCAWEQFWIWGGSESGVK